MKLIVAAIALCLLFPLSHLQTQPFLDTPDFRLSLDNASRNLRATPEFC